ncbi:MAG TPA: carbamoyl phosphate synthase small subunit [Vulgatibacter sp.]|nr:carbamoyl phosphate synthase small subunit [Vulgatibacter sp.]
MTTTSRRAILALADGTIFEGEAFGAVGEAAGDLVENTSPTGYQELLSDPASYGRIVVFACPEIGNVGVNDADFESPRIQAAGVVARHVAIAPSSHRAQRPLPVELEAAGVPGIQGIDTRMLIRRLRREGPLAALLSTRPEADPVAMAAKAKALPSAAAGDRVERVTTTKEYTVEAVGEARHHVVAYDFGVKRSALRQLAARGCRITVVPASTPASRALELEPDGIFLSSGPEGEGSAAGAPEIVKGLLGRAPILATHLGSHVLARALGASTRRLQGAHRGANQPARELAAGRVLITSQSHGRAVDEASLENTGAVITHTSVNDGSIEGFSVPGLGIQAVQFQPEASPGPRDALVVFDRFLQSMGGAA